MKFHVDGSRPTAKQIFVFGSNLAGIHGAGAAKFAYDECDADWGVGVGMMGYSYAIPTKDKSIQTLPIEKIKPYIDDFLEFARKRPNKDFFITRIGCGLAGYQDQDIAPLFKGAPDNCSFAEQWKEWL